ncbi:hypothetical protein BDR26DRAFT_514071 [Obelidium mucronatum]|nr:hypothetical protein BDR26DRAFT_514071 [Obelidium mucronatum]
MNIVLTSFSAAIKKTNKSLMTLIHLFVLPDADTDLVLLIHKLKTTLFPFLVRIAVAGVSAAPHLVVSLASAGDVAALLQTVASLGAKASEARPAQLERAASSDTLNAPLVASGGAPSHTLLLSAPKAFTKEMVQRILQFYPGVDFERSDHRVVVFNDALCASMAMDDLLSTTNFKVAFEPTSAEGQDDEALDVDDSLTTILIRNIPRSSEFEVLASQREKPVWGRCGVSAAMHSLLSKYPGFSRIHYGSKNIQAEFIDATAAYKAFGRLSASCSKMSFTLEVKPQFVSAVI